MTVYLFTFMYACIQCLPSHLILNVTASVFQLKQRYGATLSAFLSVSTLWSMCPWAEGLWVCCSGGPCAHGLRGFGFVVQVVHGLRGCGFVFQNLTKEQKGILKEDLEMLFRTAKVRNIKEAFKVFPSALTLTLSFHLNDFFCCI